MKKIVISLFACLIYALPSFAQEIYKWDYPMDKSTSGMCSTGDLTVTFEGKVSQNPNGEYVYWYKIKNTKGKKFFLQWEAVDRVLSGGYAFPHIFEMKSDKGYEFTMQTKEAPVMFFAPAIFFSKNAPSNERQIRQQIQREAGVTIKSSANDFLVGHMKCGQPAPIPRSFLDR